MLKKALIFIYIVVVVVMAAATFVEKSSGVRLYDEWWFTVLWALLTAVSVAWFLKRRVRRLSVVMLHLSFVVILLGALLTHLFSSQGAVYLRQGQSVSQYMTPDETLHDLPFSLRLDTFRIICHEGTTAAADYESHLTLTDADGASRQAVVSMNNICSHSGIRLYQTSYDADGQGSILALNSDPWGIPVTYVGYALLFVSLVWILLDPKGAYRQVLRSPLLRKGVLSLVLCLVCGHSMATDRTAEATDRTAEAAAAGRAVLPAETAARFGRLNVVYNDRVCPMQTYALDFTKKLYGKRSYEGYTAEQVLTGYLFFTDEWLDESLFMPQGTDVKAQRKAEARQIVVSQLLQGVTMKVFPHTADGKTTWYAPTDEVDTLSVPTDDRLYMGTSFMLLYEEIAAGHYDTVDRYLDKMLAYQQQNGGASIPSDTRLQAERLYNSVPFATILFIVCLTMGFLTLGLFIWQLSTGRRAWGWLYGVSLTVLGLAFAALTLCLVLRWVVSGNVPMANGYETMLLLAWLILLVTLVLYHRFRILLTFGFLLSGFFLLVSHISQMDPQIGHLMPVLNSPLLTLHVSIIMMSFALLSLTFICGLTALSIRLFKRHSEENIEALAMLSRVFLYPALTTLGLGIFIGALWANISWGNYWSWDPKETWALITFMVYAVVVHVQSFPVFRRPVAYHVFVTLAFLTLLMTYFGVNYFLGGMHSYA
ncbi:MAG: cytochrome c biogenesis protein CcsA [Prevotella sp.]|nr:cytochrome c biogenesis protein CcsA [Prevotella sp.]